jgi:oligopeptide/dipeptide ABC transporter ATP-binding protein
VIWVPRDAETGFTPTPHLLEVRDLAKAFVTRTPFRPVRRVVAAEGVSFRVGRGEAVALVGESGSGKSTIARLLLRLDQPDSGQIRLDGVDVLEREPRAASLAYRGRVQMIFQDPFGSLNPVRMVSEHLEPPLRRFGPGEGGLLRERALDLLRTVGLLPAEDFIDRLPFELSGGQRQRVAIARALAVQPDLVVADEPTSMLDVSIRTGVLNLLATLKRDRGLSILLITHDLAAARYLADRILVLYRGRVVEDGPSRALLESPAHPYTRALLASISGVGVAAPGGGKRRSAGEEHPATGCPFAPRCAEVLDACAGSDPSSRVIAPGRGVRCHLYPEQDSSHFVRSLA